MLRYCQIPGQMINEGSNLQEFEAIEKRDGATMSGAM